MKNVQTRFLIVLGVSLLFGCKENPQKSEPEKSAPEQAERAGNALQEPAKVVFQKTLSLQNISFEVQTTGEGSISELTIQPSGLEGDNEKIVQEVDGQVVGAEIEDLNADGYPEILVYTASAGSGSYGNVIGYSVNGGKSLSQIYFPDISENKEASLGYMGHDEFAIVETSLVRRFPVYKAGDPNSNPTGGTRQVQYQLKDGEAGRKLELTRITQY